jgi:tripartite-type tricarboxylate transporter receptor subunit TctC
VPAERVAALREAFETMTKDPEFTADVGKTKAELGPMPGAALQKLVADSRDVPTAVLERARAAVRR